MDVGDADGCEFRDMELEMACVDIVSNDGSYDDICSPATNEYTCYETRDDNSNSYPCGWKFSIVSFS